MSFVQGRQHGDAMRISGKNNAHQAPSKGRRMTVNGPNLCAIVIIGASGDLARRKLVPALNALYNAGTIDASTVVVGAGRTFFSESEFRSRFTITPAFAGRLFYHQHISGLKKYLRDKGDFLRVIFFLAQPP
jgi:glucose-6-phosphate 1-dehydrogenase